MVRGGSQNQPETTYGLHRSSYMAQLTMNLWQVGCKALQEEAKPDLGSIQ